MCLFALLFVPLGPPCRNAGICDRQGKWFGFRDFLFKMFLFVLEFWVKAVNTVQAKAAKLQWVLADCSCVDRTQTQSQVGRKINII